MRTITVSDISLEGCSQASKSTSLESLRLSIKMPTPPNLSAIHCIIYRQVLPCITHEYWIIVSVNVFTERKPDSTIFIAKSTIPLWLQRNNALIAKLVQPIKKSVSLISGHKGVFQKKAINEAVRYAPVRHFKAPFESGSPGQCSICAAPSLISISLASLTTEIGRFNTC